MLFITYYEEKPKGNNGFPSPKHFACFLMFYKIIAILAPPQLCESPLLNSLVRKD